MIKLRNEPDPRLKQAMAEIMAIVNRYDLASYVELHGTDAMEYQYQFSPTWSCATVTADHQFRFKCKVATGTDKEKEMGRLTVGLLMGMADQAEGHQDQIRKIVAMIGANIQEIHYVSKRF